jgi:hypothetical protein
MPDLDQIKQVEQGRGTGADNDRRSANARLNSALPGDRESSLGTKPVSRRLVTLPRR